ncbi:hypothetical protein N7490_006934 [Penicillium lividum]|nr:hypothetical protein N7490_006934 [Penicillium lividum]
MLLSHFVLAIAVSSVIASPLIERQTTITCSSDNQTPKCCQLLVPVDILGKTVDIGVGCVNFCSKPSGGGTGSGGSGGGTTGTGGGAK